MTLPPSGQISFYDINIELGRSGTAQIGLDEAESNVYAPINECSAPFPADSRPASINEWYSYNHNAASTLIGYADFSISSCAAACALNLDCSYVLYWNTAQTAVYTATSCQDYPLLGYYAICSGGSHSTCYTIGSSGTVTSTSSCTTTTTTTTSTTTTAPGECYEVFNGGGGTSGTISWTDTSGTPRTGTLGSGQTTYICSQTLPEESPPADVVVTSCFSSCSSVCTSLPCSSPCPC